MPQLSLGAPTWDGHMPDQDRMEKAGQGQQHVGQELLKAAQPVGLLPCSVSQGPGLTPRRKSFRISKKQEMTQESPNNT